MPSILSLAISVPCDTPQFLRQAAKCPPEHPSAGFSSPWSPGLLEVRSPTVGDFPVLPSPRDTPRPLLRRSPSRDFGRDDQERLATCKWLEGNLRCSVCMEGCFELALPLECLHVFCPTCLHKSVETTFNGSQKCSFCKQPFSGLFKEVYSPKDHKLVSYAEFSEGHSPNCTSGCDARRLKHLEAYRIPNEVLDTPEAFPTGHHLPEPAHFERHKSSILPWLRREIHAATFVSGGDGKMDNSWATLQCEAPAREILDLLLSEPMINSDTVRWNPKLVEILERILVSAGVGVTSEEAKDDPELKRLREKRRMIFLKDLLSFVAHPEVSVQMWDAAQTEKPQSGSRLSVSGPPPPPIEEDPVLEFSGRSEANELTE